MICNINVKASAHRPLFLYPSLLEAKNGMIISTPDLCSAVSCSQAGAVRRPFVQVRSRLLGRAEPSLTHGEQTKGRGTLGHSNSSLDASD
jgi:hypothetical protein